MMNHTDNIEYIKTILFKTYNKSTQLMKHNIADNIHNKYKLRNPAIHELCLINSMDKVNKTLSYKSVDVMNNTEDTYKLTLDNSYFDNVLLIGNNERIIPIRLIRENEIYDATACKMKILDINKNNYCGYILYELVNTNFNY